MMIITVCPTEIHSDETLFALQFATRIRNITLGTTKKNTNSKNLEENIKLLKIELKEYKTNKIIQDDTINELKKDNKKLLDKFNLSIEGKMKNIDDIKKTSELQLTTITKQYHDMSLKLSDEKDNKLKLINDNELLHKTMKKNNDNIKDLTKDNERLLIMIKLREHDIEQLKSQLQALIIKSKIPLKRPISSNFSMNNNNNNINSNNTNNNSIIDTESITDDLSMLEQSNANSNTSTNTTNSMIGSIISEMKLPMTKPIPRTNVIPITSRSANNIPSTSRISSLLNNNGTGIKIPSRSPSADRCKLIPKSRRSSTSSEVINGTPTGISKPTTTPTSKQSISTPTNPNANAVHDLSPVRSNSRNRNVSSAVRNLSVLINTPEIYPDSSIFKEDVSIDGSVNNNKLLHGLKPTVQSRSIAARSTEALQKHQVSFIQ